MVSPRLTRAMSFWLSVVVHSQVAQEREQIWVGHLHTPSKRRVETFHRIVGSRRVVAHRKPRGTDCGFLSHCFST